MDDNEEVHDPADCDNPYCDQEECGWESFEVTVTREVTFILRAQSKDQASERVTDLGPLLVANDPESPDIEEWDEGPGEDWYIRSEADARADAAAHRKLVAELTAAEEGS